MIKETIYTVDAETNKVLRASRTFLAACEFSATLKEGEFYICTSEFEKKRGEYMSNIVDFLV